MTIGIVGQKAGMTRMFQLDGTSVPVTVIYAKPNKLVQLKNRDVDGYCALQLSYGAKKATRVNKPTLANYINKNLEPGLGLQEFRVSEQVVSSHAVGDEFGVDQFKVGQKVDVIGISKGKGFSGVIKRHHFASQDASHGNSLSHRAPGSLGQNQSPGRVFKGKKMAGQLGSARRTALNLEVVSVNSVENLILVKGAVPGFSGSVVTVRASVKN